MRGAVPALAVVAALAPSALAAQQPVDALQGAWQIVEVSSAAGTNSSPEPGLLLFTGGYYSYTLVNRSRPAMPGGLPTASELLAVWNPFSANAGTFELSGDTMTRRPLVAKDPRAMEPGAFNEYAFRISADTLWLTTIRTEAGPAMNPATVRFLRLR
jgi:hypothetical protein